MYFVKCEHVPENMFPLSECIALFTDPKPRKQPDSWEAGVMPMSSKESIAAAPENKIHICNSNAQLALAVRHSQLRPDKRTNRSKKR